MITRVTHIFPLIALTGFLLCAAGVTAQDPWVLTAEQPLQGDYYGITSANGQIGLVSSREPLQVDKLVVGGLYDLYAPGRVNNYFPNINPLDILLEVDGAPVQSGDMTAYTQQMNLKNAAFTGAFEYGGKVRMEYTTAALRHLPFGFVTDVRMTAQQACEVRVANRHRTPDNLLEPQAFFSRIKNKLRTDHHGTVACRQAPAGSGYGVSVPRRDCRRHAVCRFARRDRRTAHACHDVHPPYGSRRHPALLRRGQHHGVEHRTRRA